MCMPPGTLTDDVADELVSACRTTVGDHLRSITVFTADDFEQVYLRSDLEQDADLTGFVDYESRGFGAERAYRNSELGEYSHTIRVFENGYLLRVTDAEAGVLVTTDGLTLRNFREAAGAAKEILGSA